MRVRLIIEPEDFVDGDAGGAAGAAHNRGVIAGTEREEDRRFTVVGRSQGAGLNLGGVCARLQVVVTRDEVAVRVVQFHYRIHQAPGDRRATNAEGWPERAEHYSFLGNAGNDGAVDQHVVVRLHIGAHGFVHELAATGRIEVVNFHHADTGAVARAAQDDGVIAGRE